MAKPRVLSARIRATDGTFEAFSVLIQIKKSRLCIENEKKTFHFFL